MDKSYLDVGGKVFTINMTKLGVALHNDEPRTGIEKEEIKHYGESGNKVESTIKTKEFDKGLEINAPKYNLINICLETVFSERDEVDDGLGFERAMKETSFSFKLAFNTLLDYGILEEV